jgi:hypothetical protein
MGTNRLLSSAFSRFPVSRQVGVASDGFVDARSGVRDGLCRSLVGN